MSGGHGGLIAAVFKILKRHSLSHHEESQIQQLLGYDAVAGECRKIWNSLEAQEHELLLQWAQGNLGINNLAVDSLTAKGVISKDRSGQPIIFSPLFQKFLSALA
jgi:hypothetical protein